MKYVIGFLQRLLSLICIILLMCGLFMFTLSHFSMELPAVFGYRLLPVETAEMQPAVAKGDAVVLERKSSYAVGDVVAFSKEGKLTIRRLVGISGDAFIIKAETAAVEEENLLDREEIAGQVVLSITYFGGFLMGLKNLYVMGALLAALLLILLLPRFAGVGKSHRIEEAMPEDAAYNRRHTRRGAQNNVRYRG